MTNQLGRTTVESGTRRLRSGISRRSFLRTSVAIGAAGAAGTALRPAHARLIDAALASDQSMTGSLSDVEHIVILMQENRSFDHYFGTMSDVRGFSDPSVPKQLIGGSRATVFEQLGPKGYSVGGQPYLQPFELISSFPTQPGQTTNDITHDWGPQHYAWNSGAMDQFLKAHLATDGATNGFLTMGYFTRDGLPFYHALADAFTVCDGYFCSVIGPTHPNRLMQMSGSLGATGEGGAPVLVTYTDPISEYGQLNWLTMPEVLTDSGVSWKVYQDPTSTVLFNILPFFKNYISPSNSRDTEVAANGLLPQYPAEFIADVATGNLPAVSWILPMAAACEHPAAPPEYGEWLASQILSTLVSNPDVWAKTIFLIIYDENGGWFDHVPPPTPGPLALSKGEIPTGDEFVGEYVTAPLPSPGNYGINGQNLSIYGPVGLGFRTPCLVISPFSRGGYVCSETFDHISVLKLISARFGAPVPNASKWRMNTVGDMTGALALGTAPDLSVPSLPATSLIDPEVAAQAVVDAVLGTVSEAPIPYPAPTQNTAIPVQESVPVRIRLPLQIALPGAAAAATSSGGQGGGSGSSGGGRHRADLGYGNPTSSVTAAGGSSTGTSQVPGGANGTRGRARHLAERAGSGGGDGTGIIAGVVGGVAAIGVAAAATAKRWLPLFTRSDSGLPPHPDQD